jgi:hypothetical protein
VTDQLERKQTMKKTDGYLRNTDMPQRSCMAKIKLCQRYISFVNFIATESIKVFDNFFFS